MKNNALFLGVIIITIILSGFNILDFRKGKLRQGSLKKQLNKVEVVLLIFLIVAIYFISKVRYQMDAIFMALIIYLIPLALINFKVYLIDKSKELVYCGLVFFIIIILSTVLLVAEIL